MKTRALPQRGWGGRGPRRVGRRGGLQGGTKAAGGRGASSDFSRRPAVPRRHWTRRARVRPRSVTARTRAWENTSSRRRSPPSTTARGDCLRAELAAHFETESRAGRAERQAAERAQGRTRAEVAPADEPAASSGRFLGRLLGRFFGRLRGDGVIRCREQPSKCGAGRGAGGTRRGDARFPGVRRREGRGQGSCRASSTGAPCHHGWQGACAACKWRRARGPARIVGGRAEPRAHQRQGDRQADRRGGGRRLAAGVRDGRARYQSGGVVARRAAFDASAKVPGREAGTPPGAPSTGSPPSAGVESAPSVRRGDGCSRRKAGPTSPLRPATSSRPHTLLARARLPLRVREPTPNALRVTITPARPRAHRWKAVATRRRVLSRPLHRSAGMRVRRRSRREPPPSPARRRPLHRLRLPQPAVRRPRVLPWVDKSVAVAAGSTSVPSASPAPAAPSRATSPGPSASVPAAPAPRASQSGPCGHGGTARFGPPAVSPRPEPNASPIAASASVPKAVSGAAVANAASSSPSGVRHWPSSGRGSLEAGRAGRRTAASGAGDPPRPARARRPPPAPARPWSMHPRPRDRSPRRRQRLPRPRRRSCLRRPRSSTPPGRSPRRLGGALRLCAPRLIRVSCAIQASGFLLRPLPRRRPGCQVVPATIEAGRRGRSTRSGIGRSARGLTPPRSRALLRTRPRPLNPLRPRRLRPTPRRPSPSPRRLAPLPRRAPSPVRARTALLRASLLLPPRPRPGCTGNRPGADNDGCRQGQRCSRPAPAAASGGACAQPCDPRRPPPRLPSLGTARSRWPPPSRRAAPAQSQSPAPPAQASEAPHPAPSASPAPARASGTRDQHQQFSHSSDSSHASSENHPAPAARRPEHRRPRHRFRPLRRRPPPRPAPKHRCTPVLTFRPLRPAPSRHPPVRARNRAPARWPIPTAHPGAAPESSATENPIAHHAALQAGTPAPAPAPTEAEPPGKRPSRSARPPPAPTATKTPAASTISISPTTRQSPEPRRRREREPAPARRRAEHGVRGFDVMGLAPPPPPPARGRAAHFEQRRPRRGGRRRRFDADPLRGRCWRAPPGRAMTPPRSRHPRAKGPSGRSSPRRCSAAGGRTCGTYTGPAGAPAAAPESAESPNPGLSMWNHEAGRAPDHCRRQRKRARAAPDACYRGGADIRATGELAPARAL